MVKHIAFFVFLYKNNYIVKQQLQFDNKIEDFTSLSLLILDGYQYFIGSLLASNIVGIENKDFRNINMINVTNHLNEYTITSLLKLILV